MFIVLLRRFLSQGAVTFTVVWRKTFRFCNRFKFSHKLSKILGLKMIYDPSFMSLLVTVHNGPTVIRNFLCGWKISCIGFKLVTQIHCSDQPKTAWFEWFFKWKKSLMWLYLFKFAFDKQVSAKWAGFEIQCYTQCICA